MGETLFIWRLLEDFGVGVITELEPPVRTARPSRCPGTVETEAKAKVWRRATVNGTPMID